MNKEGIYIASLFERVILQEGLGPEKLISDNGSEFLNRHMEKVCRDFKIDHRTTEAYYSSKTNGVIEKCDYTVKKHVFSYMLEHKTKKYVAHMPRICYLYNNQIHTY